MKKNYLLTLSLLFTIFYSNAQDTAWSYHGPHHGDFNEDKAYAVTQTSDKGFVFVSRYGFNGFGNTDIQIAKLDESGGLLWSKVYAGFGGDEPRAIKELSDHSFIVSGFTRNLGGSAGDTAFIKNLLMKFAENGDSVWSRRYGSDSIGFGEGLGGGVDTTGDGGFVTIGKYYTGQTNGNDFYLVRTDANGDTLWTKLFGGTGADIPRSVIHTSDNGFMIAGTTKSFGDNPGFGNIWLVKTNSTGDTLWTKAIGSTHEEECYSVKQTVDGGYLLIGRTGDIGSNESEIYIVKTDQSGNVVMNNSFGNPFENDYGRDIIQATDGGYVFTSARTATHGYYLLFPLLMYVGKTDTSGNLLWDKELGYDNSPNGSYGYNIQQTADSGYVVAGFDQPLSQFAGVEDIRSYIVKFKKDKPSGIAEVIEANKGFVFPNPFSETTKIILPHSVKEKTTLEVFNTTGQKILSRSVEVGTKEIIIKRGNLLSGIYFCRLSDSDFRGELVVE